MKQRESTISDPRKKEEREKENVGMDGEKKRNRNDFAKVKCPARSRHRRTG